MNSYSRSATHTTLHETPTLVDTADVGRIGRRDTFTMTHKAEMKRLHASVRRKYRKRFLTIARRDAVDGDVMRDGGDWHAYGEVLASRDGSTSVCTV